MTAPDRRSIADPKQPSCLVLHGLGGGRYELEPVIAALEAEGLRVSAPILPGHDGPGPIMPSSSWRDWAATAESAFDDLAAEGAPVVVLGFSTGATLALYLAGRRPVARQVLMAPFLAIRYSGLIRLHPATYIRFLARFKPDLPRRRPAVRDPEMRRQAARLDRFRTFNLNAALSALELIEEVKAIVPRIDHPDAHPPGTARHRDRARPGGLAPSMPRLRPEIAGHPARLGPPRCAGPRPATGHRPDARVRPWPGGSGPGFRDRMSRRISADPSCRGDRSHRTRAGPCLDDPCNKATPGVLHGLSMTSYNRRGSGSCRSVRVARCWDQIRDPRS